MEHDSRPWGEYWVLDSGPTYKVKRILVNPGGKLSLQYHKFRAEVWTIVDGVGTVTLDGIVQDLGVGEVVRIKLGAQHRMENKYNNRLIFIEVQHGTYFGEDDIVRIEDEYNRN